MLAPPSPGARHYLVNAHHPDLAKHPTTQSLLRQLYPLAQDSGAELQRKLDAIQEHAFTAGESADVGNGSQSAEQSQHMEGLHQMQRRATRLGSGRWTDSHGFAAR